MTVNVYARMYEGIRKQLEDGEISTAEATRMYEMTVRLRRRPTPDPKHAKPGKPDA